MVRIDGKVMSNVRYAELLQEKKSRTLMKRINMYFFDEEDICLHDFLWFYGTQCFALFVCLIVTITGLVLN